MQVEFAKPQFRMLADRDDVNSNPHRLVGGTSPMAIVVRYGFSNKTTAISRTTPSLSYIRPGFHSFSAKPSLVLDMKCDLSNSLQTFLLDFTFTKWTPILSSVMFLTAESL